MILSQCNINIFTAEGGNALDLGCPIRISFGTPTILMIFLVSLRPGMHVSG
jgi:hypothetical protein